MAQQDVINKLKERLMQTYGGDLEDMQLKHCQTLFTEEYKDPVAQEGWAASMKQLLVTIGEGPNKPIVDFPVRDEKAEFWVASWQLGFAGDSAVRGRPNMINVLEVATSFLDKTYNSLRSQIWVTTSATVVPGSKISDFSLRHSVGFTRSLACKVILDLVLKLALSDAELRAIADLLRSVLVIKAIYEPTAGEQDLLSKSLLDKFQVSESTRPDILQLYFAFDQCLKKEGIQYADAIEGRIQAFNRQTSVESYKLSEAETKMLMLLPKQTESFLQMLSYHWGQFKAAESACPLRLLVAHIDRKKVDSSMPKKWQDIFTSSPEKNFAFLERQIGIYIKAVKEAQKTQKKAVNLAFRSVFWHKFGNIWFPILPPEESRITLINIKD